MFDCCGLRREGNGPADDGGGVWAPLMEQVDRGWLTQQPPPSYQPQMEWTPVSSAAADGIQ